ncbi:AAA family ATPase [Dactylosporangium sp. CA-233914]|uniref:AAA family ATPase n=1 Tax=Dactylosporangium sp. CA-233914 TaxID=3239934 RepID=UPI003D8FBB7E
MLVTRISEALPKSLVLLDEPEVSLHPGAQRRLMSYRSMVTMATTPPVQSQNLPLPAKTRPIGSAAGVLGYERPCKRAGSHRHEDP